jgi:hypothetical protein
MTRAVELRYNREVKNGVGWIHPYNLPKSGRVKVLLEMTN